MARQVGLPWGLVPVLCLPAVVSSWDGAALALWIPAKPLTWIVISALVLVGMGLLRHKRRVPQRGQPR